MTSMSSAIPGICALLDEKIIEQEIEVHRLETRLEEARVKQDKLVFAKETLLEMQEAPE